MNRFSNTLKKPCFWPILGPFSRFFNQKKNVLENPALWCTSSYVFLAPSQNLEKVHNTIQRKRLDRQKDRQTEWQKEGMTNRQTLSYRTLLATARVQQNSQSLWDYFPNCFQIYIWTISFKNSIRKYMNFV